MYPGTMKKTTEPPRPTAEDMAVDLELMLQAVEEATRPTGGVKTAMSAASACRRALYAEHELARVTAERDTIKHWKEAWQDTANKANQEIERLLGRIALKQSTLDAALLQIELLKERGNSPLPLKPPPENG